MWQWLCKAIINVNIIFEDCQSQCLIDVPIAVRMRWLLNWKPDLEYGGEGRLENLQSGFVEALSFCCLRIHWSSVVLLKLCRGCVESPLTEMFYPFLSIWLWFEADSHESLALSMEGKREIWEFTIARMMLCCLVGRPVGWEGKIIERDQGF